VTIVQEFKSCVPEKEQFRQGIDTAEKEERVRDVKKRGRRFEFIVMRA